MILEFLSVLDFLGTLAGLVHPWVQFVQVVQLQQSLVRLWLQGNQVLLAVPGFQTYLVDLFDPSALTVLEIPFLPWNLLGQDFQEHLGFLGYQDLL